MVKKRVLRIREIKKAPVGKREANSQGLAILVSARPPIGAFYSALKQNARKMQENPTPHENLLLKKLLSEKIDFKFQQIFPPYIVDFMFPNRLIVELDGNPHSKPENESYDCDRDCYIMSFGFTVLRIKNKEIINNMDKVINSIKEFISTKTIPKPYRKLNFLIELYKKDKVTKRRLTNILGKRYELVY